LGIDHSCVYVSTREFARLAIPDAHVISDDLPPIDLEDPVPRKPIHLGMPICAGTDTAHRDRCTLGTCERLDEALMLVSVNDQVRTTLGDHLRERRMIAEAADA
jgi:hypothetical protein